MKTKHLFSAITVVFSISACAPMPKIDYMGKPDCVGAAGTIIVTANNMNFSVQPPNLCVRNGDTVTVQVAGAPGAGDVEVSGKASMPEAKWIKGDNSANKNQFTFTVPDASKAKPGDTYLYNVIVQGFGVIDPMLTVQR